MLNGLNNRYFTRYLLLLAHVELVGTQACKSLITRVPRCN